MEEDIVLSLLASPSFVFRPLGPGNAWIEHTSFAFWLMRHRSPRTFVELGTHFGDSYFSFCHAVQKYDLVTKCFAVDSWKGDDLAGKYGEEVFGQVNGFNQHHFSSFSTLVRGTFDEASQFFGEGSIDLLHIDGFHSYEAVKRDFETWKPKLSPNAIVLFHDTQVRREDFGVWRFWNEIRQQHRNHFEFNHGHGLGVLSLNPDPQTFFWNSFIAKEQDAFLKSFQDLGRLQNLYCQADQSSKSLHGECSRLSTELQNSLASCRQVHSALDQNKTDLVQKEARVAALSQDLAAGQDRINLLAQELAAKVSELASSSSELEEGTRQLTLLKDELAAREIKTGALTEQLAVARDWAEQRGAQVEELSRKLGTEQYRLTLLAQELAARESELEEISRELDYRTTLFVDELASSNGDREEARRQLTLLSGELAARDIKAAAQTEQLAVARHTAASLAQELEAFRNEMEMARQKSVQEELQKTFGLSSELAAKEQKVASLNQELAAKEKQVSSLALELAEKEHQIARFEKYEPPAENHVGTRSARTRYTPPKSTTKRNGRVPVRTGEPAANGHDERSLKVLFIGHDATRTGAPVLLLECIKSLKKCYGINPEIILQEGGPLVEAYDQVGNTTVLSHSNLHYDEARKLACEQFAEQNGDKVVLCNTIAANSYFSEYFSARKIPVATWIHEMAVDINNHFGGQEKIKQISLHSDRLVYPGEVCRKDHVRHFKINAATEVIPYGRTDLLPNEERMAAGYRESVRLELQLPATAILVLGCGSVEERKGPDLFVDMAQKFLEAESQSDLKGEVYFIWAGRSASEQTRKQLDARLVHQKLSNRIRFIGEVAEPRRFFLASDAFILSSRSDPYPLVVLEAIAYGLPVMAFDQGNGSTELIEQGFGSLVPFLDVQEMAHSLGLHLKGARKIRPDGFEFIRSLHSPQKCAERFHELFATLISERRNPSVLVISQGPPPVCGNIAEGGGLRNWGLAKSIKALLPKSEVTLAYTVESARKIKNGIYEGVNVQLYSTETLSSLVRRHSSILISYCYGESSKQVAEMLTEDQQLILDCYVPIYIEVSARNSEFVEREYEHYLSDSYNKEGALRRGDIFLCANQAQYIFYQGVLSAFSRVNPITYHDSGLRIVPYGIDSEPPIATSTPYTSLLSKPEAKPLRLLWFGAVYPWFEIEILLEAVYQLNTLHPTTLAMVGISNPFVNHPDFVERAQSTKKLIATDRFKEIVFSQDWVPFEERANWYLDCDLIVTLNQSGFENSLAWRTRVVDYVWAGMPLATNGGDPLGEELIACGAARRLDVSNSHNLCHSLQDIFGNPQALIEMAQAMKKYRPKLYWSEIIKPLVRDIRDRRLAPDRFISMPVDSI